MNLPNPLAKRPRVLMFLAALVLLCQPLIAAEKALIPAVHEFGTIHTSAPTGDVLSGPFAKDEIYTADFQDENGFPDNDGWFAYSIPNYWHIDTYNSPLGGYAMRCGRVYAQGCGGTDPVQGYGNDWHQVLEWVQPVPPLAPTDVSVTFDLNFDVEPDFDYLVLRALTNSGYWVLETFTGSTFDTGSGTWQPLIGQTVDFTVDPGSLPADELVLEFLAFSDASGSDEDCDFPSAGFAQLDNIVVAFADKGVVTVDDFEGGLGASNWQPRAGGATGGFAAVWPELYVLPGCTPNPTPQVAFVDPAHECVTWCYGPDARTVNSATDLHDLFVSPAIPWPDPAETGAEIAFDVYRHFPMGNDYSGLAYVWYVRSIDTGDPADLDGAPWRSYGLAYTGAPGYVTHTEDVSTLLVRNRTHMQLALGVRNVGPGPDWGGSDTTPAPYFDDVTVTSYMMIGPAMSALEQDLGQDNFPASGVIDYMNLGANAVPFDAAVSTTSGPTVTPRSEIRVEIVSVLPGSLVEPPLMHYLIQPNPLYAGERSYPTEGTVPGTAVGPTTYEFDPPDDDFLFPGDIVHYYFEAVDAYVGTGTLPADLTDYRVFGSTSTYEKAFILHALPSMDSAVPGDQPAILLWDDGAARDGDAEWTTALAQYGYEPGRDYDLYWTNAPASGLSNGLGGRATTAVLEGYDVILYSCGDLAAHTLSTGAGPIDYGDDLGLLEAWLDSGDRNLLLTGNNLAFDLSQTTAGSVFLDTRLGVQFHAADIRPLIDDQVWPLVESDDLTIFPPDTRWRVDGAEPGLGEFDAVTAVTGVATREAEFTDRNGSGGAYPYAAATLAQGSGDALVFMPYDLEYVTLPKPPGGTMVATLVGHILGLFSGDPVWWLPGLPSGATSSAMIDWSGTFPPPPQPLSVFVVPGAGGQSLKDAQMFGGGTWDATIHVTARNASGGFLANFPKNAISLQGAYAGSPAPTPAIGPVYCEHLPADDDTDGVGYTTISGIMVAGGHSDYPDEKLYVSLSGELITNTQDFELYYNSADINGDRRVDMFDYQMFVADFCGGYHYRSDFYWDGVINLSDIVMFASAFDEGCADPAVATNIWGPKFRTFHLNDHVMYLGWNWAVHYGELKFGLSVPSYSTQCLPVTGYACNIQAEYTGSYPFFQTGFQIDPRYCGFTLPWQAEEPIDDLDIIAAITPPIEEPGWHDLGSFMYFYMTSSGPVKITVGPSRRLDYLHAITTSDDDIYVQQRNKNGAVDDETFWINPDKPILEGIYDVPDDQGLAVRIDTWRSAYDDPVAPQPVTSYEVYRLQTGWELVSTVPADGADHKQFVVPTLCDSTSAGLCSSTFMIRACTDDPQVYFDSDPITGHSIDNLVPAPTEGLVADFHHASVDLAWTVNPAPDVDHYNIYRGTDPGTPPAGEPPFAQTASTQWTDDLGGVPGTGYGYVYWVAAVDDAGQEGEPSVWTASTVTGADLAPPPAFALHDNVPNPFNPRTVLRYDLPESAKVKLEIYDVTGALIRVLRNGAYEPTGRREAVWNGCDDAGRRAPSGVYFCRMEAKGFRATQRMMLVK